MGACLGAGVYDKYSLDFTNELPITKMKDQHYITFLDSKNIFKDREGLLRELLINKKTLFLDENQKYFQNLNALPDQTLFVALLFLCQCDYKSFSTRYLLVVEKVRNKYYENFQQKLDETNRSEYEVLKEVLICYCKIVSSQIVNSSLQVEKTKREARIVNSDLIDTYGEEVYNNLKKLQIIYHSDVVEKFVVNFLLAHFNASSNIKHEELYNRIFDSISHLNVRQKLREIFDEHYTISFDNKTNEYYRRGLYDKYRLPEKVEQTSVNPNSAINNELLVSSRKPVTSTVIAPLEVEKISDPSLITKTYYTSSYGRYQAGNYFENPTVTKIYDAKNANYDAQLVSSSNNTRYKTTADSNTYISNLYNTNSSYAIVPLNIDSSKFDYEQFKRSFLKFHNTIRKEHQAEELVEASWLSSYSQIHANFLAQYEKLTPSQKEFGDKTLGENIGSVFGVTNEAVETLLNEWYEKRKFYNFQYPKYQPEASSFTQMIWKGTKQIGFGVAFNKTGNTYVTINYYPQGNALDSFTENVKPGLN